MKSIKPVYKHCGCGRRLSHHHILCDACHRRKMKFKRQGFITEPRPMKEYIQNETNKETEETK
jgi:hypothetical protein